MMNNQNFWKLVVKKDAALNPVDRVAEILFGLIMVLSFTGTISVATNGREQIRELLWAALGCNLAWGLVDAIMYLMNVAIERGRNLTIIKRLANSENPESSRQVLKEEIQPLISTLMNDEELDQLNDRLKKMPLPLKKHILTIKDFIAAVQIFLIVFLCTVPVALPFLFFKEVPFAMRTSNGVALVLLFIGGYILASYAGFRRFMTALIYVVIGLSLVALTIALGG
jgi:hypothetical protein